MERCLVRSRVSGGWETGIRDSTAGYFFPLERLLTGAGQEAFHLPKWSARRVHSTPSLRVLGWGWGHPWAQLR